MEETLTKKVTVPSYLKVGKFISILFYIWVLYGVIVLSLRVFLLAASANSTTPFVNFIYRTSADYLAPFRGIFPPKAVGETGYLDIASLFAIIIYLLIAWLVSSGIKYIQSKIDHINDEEADRKAKLEEERMLEGQNITKKTTYVSQGKAKV